MDIQFVRKIRPFLTFYRNFIGISLIVNGTAGVLYWMSGPDVLSGLMIFKLGTFPLIGYFIVQFRRKEFSYYLNLGISRSQLFVTTFTGDLLFFTALIAAIHNLI